MRFFSIEYFLSYARAIFCTICVNTRYRISINILDTYITYQTKKNSILTIYPKAICKNSDYLSQDLRLAPPTPRRIKSRAFDVAVKKRKSKEQLNDHRSFFSASSLKAWPCDRCGKRYMWRDSLTKHLRVECGKAPTFECPICGRKFKHKHRWQSHARLIHYLNI